MRPRFKEMFIELFFLTCALYTRKCEAVPLAPGLADPASQLLFQEIAPNALDSNYVYQPEEGYPDQNYYKISMGVGMHETGLRNAQGQRVKTRIFGYGQDGDYRWPGKTIVVQSSKAGGLAKTFVEWHNELGNYHILPVDTTVHWAFSVDGYKGYSIAQNGVPVIPHLHGAPTDFQFDGDPEYFFTPNFEVVGPQWDRLVPGGFTNVFEYDNNVDAAALWIHDHTLGIMRLNVYAGLASFYIVRDNLDTGKVDNPLGLPAEAYELAYVIQDHIFYSNGKMHYPAYPEDPFYADFIESELPSDQFANGGPTALAEFFGDIMLVNGVIWPKIDVEPREYRLRLLNGCDSRYLVIDFRMVDAGATSVENSVPLVYTIIGSDGGLGNPSVRKKPFVLEPGARYDIVIDMSQAIGKRVIMHNLGGDAPFGGAYGYLLTEDDVFEDRRTDRIMAFDVVKGYPVDTKLDLSLIPAFTGIPADNAIRREVALFEGLDEFGRLQPVLGTKANSSSDPNGLYPAYTWSGPTTEKPRLGTIEEWYILNFSADAHPVHLHLVHFEIIGDFMFTYEVDDAQEQVLHQHNGATGTVPKITAISTFVPVQRSRVYYKGSLKDMVVVLPGDPDAQTGRGTIIRTVPFPKTGRYNYHCHILSHEDHEMMRIFFVESDTVKAPPETMGHEQFSEATEYTLDRGYPHLRRERSYNPDGA